MSETEIRHAVGVDFGGTFIKMAVVSERGEIKARTRINTAEAATPELWLKAVARGVDQLVAEARLTGSRDLRGVGVGVPGFVDYGRGFVFVLPNVPGWTKVPLAPRLEDLLGLHVRVDNDVNAMAIGECTFGAGRAYQHAVFVTLGTGVGGGLLIDNKLYRGAFSMAGEIGHISIEKEGVQSPQGKGGLEQYIGNRRIVEYALSLVDGGRPSAMLDLVGGDRTRLNPDVINKAAAAGDRLALDVFDYVADCLATAFASITYLIQPQAFIVGGGVALSGPVLFEQLRRHLAARLNPFFAERIEVKQAELGNDAGVIGSAKLVLVD